MALTQVPIELSSTPGIVDNSNATAITIDSSENVLVGKSATAVSSDGIEARNNGLFVATRDSNKSAILNRRSSDGDILEFMKDSVAVGSIASEGGDALIIQSGTTSGSGLHFHPTSALIRPARNGVTVDAVLNLGAGTRRFKDLFLSGGAYLGGTASANKLDDYEEGIHDTTVAFTNSGSVTLGNNRLTYTKIGQQVIVTGYVSLTATSSPSGIMLFTLPFPVANGAQYRASANVKFNQLLSGNNMTTAAWAIANMNTSTVAVYGGSGHSVDSGTGARLASNTDFRVSVTYVTSA